MSRARACLQGMAQEETDVTRFCDILIKAKSIYIIGSGTSYHSALLAKHIFTKVAKIRTEPVLSSEFQYVLDFIDKDSVILAISQSGETARYIKFSQASQGSRSKDTFHCQCQNVFLARISESFLTINCGPEVGVAATKKALQGGFSVIYTVIEETIQQVHRNC